MHVAIHVSMTFILKSYRLFWLPLHTVTPTGTLTRALPLFTDDVPTEASVSSTDERACALSSSGCGPPALTDIHGSHGAYMAQQSARFWGR